LDHVLRDYAQRLSLDWRRPLADVMVLRRLLTPRRMPNGVTVTVQYANTDAACVLEFPGPWRVRLDDELVLQLQQLLGPDCVKVSFRKYVAPVSERRFAAAAAGAFDDE